MKRKSYPRLPNGFGSIRYLGKGRKNPYAVLAPSTSTYKNGESAYDKPIAYVDTWNKGFSVLVMYHAGTYDRGNDIPEVLPDTANKSMVDEIVNNIARMIAPSYLKGDGLTFSEVYDRFYNDKYNQTKRVYSDQSKQATKSAFKNCVPLHDKTFKNLKHIDLQQIVDELPLKHSSKELVVLLFHQMCKYAVINEIIDKDISTNVSIKEKDDDEHGIPFSEDEIQTLWDNKDDRIARFLLIMIYSGFRIREYENMEVNLEEMYFKGGSKTKAGKDRTVPIHTCIYDLVESSIKEYGKILPFSYAKFTYHLDKFLKEHSIIKHTAHDCRHTFSMLCDKYDVNETEKKRMLGHAFKDITNRVYGHSDLDKQKKELAKIQVP
jgi:hypothetical protein|nr:MAG TPA: Integrase [Siphoviridae sp. ctuK76]